MNLRMNRSYLALLGGPLCLAALAWGATSKASSSTVAVTHTAAPDAAPVASPSKPNKEGEINVEVSGTRKDKLTVGKIDPPAAFNLEDIQNFPEERLNPVLNNPVTFEEGRDFSSMLDSMDAKLIHPWLPEIPQSPYLTMKTAIDKPARDWTFSVIDQGGSTVMTRTGQGNPPSLFSWTGEDKERGYLAVDTVYIPQLATTDKEGYRHTYPGEPKQFAMLLYRDRGRSVVEISTKRLFLDRKSSFSKEAPVFLEKVGDLIRAEARVPFGIQIYDSDLDLAGQRQKALQTFFADQLLIPETQITLLSPQGPDKRGLAVAIVLNGTPGGAQ